MKIAKVARLVLGYSLLSLGLVLLFGWIIKTGALSLVPISAEIASASTMITGAILVK